MDLPQERGRRGARALSAGPARTLVVGAVAMGLVASIAPLAAGIGLERALEDTPDRLLVYHALFALTAVFQAVNWWPLCVFRADSSDASGEPPRNPDVPRSNRASPR